MSPPGSSRRLIKQYVATKKGGPFQVVQADYPTPGPDEICIRNRAVGLNPLDIKSLHYGMMVKGYPEVLGIDCAGVVEAVGEKVTDFKAGDAVMSLAGFGGKAGAFQDITTVPSHFAAKKPSGWTFEEAASVPLIYLTASAAILKGLSIRLPFMQDPPKDLLGGPDGISHVDHHNRNHSISVTKSLLTSMLNNKDNEENEQREQSTSSSSSSSSSSSALNPLSPSAPNPPAHRRPPHPTINTGTPHTSKPLSPNTSPRSPKLTSVLILGGTSGVGSSTLQLLRIALGPTATLITTNSPSQNPHCLKLGATSCIDRSLSIDKLVAAIKAATDDGKGVDAIIDAVGATSADDKGDGQANSAANVKLFEALRKDGPKLFSQVMTSPQASITQQIPGEMGVKAAQPVFGRMTFEVVPGGMRAMSRLTELVESGGREGVAATGGAKFKLPLNVEVVGKGLEAIGGGLEKLKEGVSGTKLVVSL